MKRFFSGCLRWVFVLFLVAGACAVVAQLAANGDFFTPSRSSSGRRATATRRSVVANSTSRSAMPAINTSDKPTQVTSAHISEYQQIQQQAANGQISKTQARNKLETLALKVGKNGLAWLTRHVPIKDPRTGRWVSFDTYARAEAQAAGFKPDSRFANDPVGTTADLMFGDYSVEDFVAENFDLGLSSSSGKKPTPTPNARVQPRPTIRTTPLVNTVKTKVKSGVDTAKTQVQIAKTKAKSAADVAKTKAKNAADIAKTKAKSAANAAKTKAKSGIDKAKDWLDDLIK